MPTLDDYRRLAPFSLEELIAAANVLLRPRPDQEVTRRSIRYHIAEGVVQAPSGPPKFARYGFEHLVAVLATRALQDRGMNLGEVRERLETLAQGDVARFARLVQDWLDKGPRRAERSSAERAEWPSRPAYSAGVSAREVLRIRLTGQVTLEVDRSRTSREDLARAHDRLAQLIAHWDERT